MSEHALVPGNREQTAHELILEAARIAAGLVPADALASLSGSESLIDDFVKAIRHRLGLPVQIFSNQLITTLPSRLASRFAWKTRNGLWVDRHLGVRLQAMRRSTTSPRNISGVTRRIVLRNVDADELAAELPSSPHTTLAHIAVLLRTQWDGGAGVLSVDSKCRNLFLLPEFDLVVRWSKEYYRWDVEMWAPDARLLTEGDRLFTVN